MLMVKGWRSKVEYQDWTLNVKGQMLKIKGQILNVKGWMLKVGCCMLKFASRILEMECFIPLGPQHTLKHQHATFKLWHLILNIQFSTSNLQYLISICELHHAQHAEKRLEFEAYLISKNEVQCCRNEFESYITVEVCSLYAKENPYWILMDIPCHIVKYLK